MIRQLLMRRSGVREATVILAVASLVSRLFGLLRDRVLASHLGASPVSDAYFAAFRVPDLVFNLLILGALSSVFIPVFTGYLKRERGGEAWVFVNTLVNVGIVVTALVLLILFFFAPALAKLVAPGFAASEQLLVARLMRIMLLSPLIFGLSNLVGGILNTFRNFFVYSLAPIFYNLGIIFGVFFLLPVFGPLGLAYGVILGALAHLLVQLPSVFLLGYRYQPSFNIYHPALKRVGVLMAPRILGLAVGQATIFLNTIIASTLAVGSISVLNYADNIYSLPVSLFGISLAVAVFPTLSQQASTSNLRDFKRVLVSSLRQVAFFILPVMVLYFLLRAQIVRLILGAGLFGWEETRFTISVLAFMTLGMIAHALIPLLARAFYARQDTLTPFWTGLLALLVDILAALILIQYLKVVGLALAISLAALFNMAGLIFFLQRRLKLFDWAGLLNFTSRVVLAALSAGLAGYWMLRVLDLVVETRTGLGLLLQAGVVALIFVFLYLALVRIFRVPEAEFVKAPFKFLKRWVG